MCIYLHWQTSAQLYLSRGKEISRAPLLAIQREALLALRAIRRDTSYTLRVLHFLRFDERVAQIFNDDRGVDLAARFSPGSGAGE